jgi:hypothetical protein
MYQSVEFKSACIVKVVHYLLYGKYGWHSNESTCQIQGHVWVRLLNSQPFLVSVPHTLPTNGCLFELNIPFQLFYVLVLKLIFIGQFLRKECLARVGSRHWKQLWRWLYMNRVVCWFSPLLWGFFSSPVFPLSVKIILPINSNLIMDRGQQVYYRIPLYI